MKNPLKQYENIVGNKDIKIISAISINDKESISLMLTQDLTLVNTLQMIIIKLTYSESKGTYFHNNESLQEEVLFRGEYYRPHKGNTYEQAIICLNKYYTAKERLGKLKQLNYAI